MQVGYVHSQPTKGRFVVLKECNKIQWNLSIVVTIVVKFFGCYRQVAALMR